MTDNLLDNEIPEKFKDPQTGQPNLQALVSSYKELEKRFSQKPNAPKTPDEYCIDCSHGLFEPDPEVNRRLHEKGLSDEQVQEVYNLAAEKMVPMIMELVRDFEADREVEKLIKHFGGPEKWKAVAHQIMAFGKRNLPSDVFESLSTSYEGVMALHRMMASEEPSIEKRGDIAAGVSENDLQSMMRDPRYWREKDPGFVTKVTEGYEALYNKKQ